MARLARSAAPAGALAPTTIAGTTDLSATADLLRSAVAVRSYLLPSLNSEFWFRHRRRMIEVLIPSEKGHRPVAASLKSPLAADPSRAGGVSPPAKLAWREQQAIVGLVDGDDGELQAWASRTVAGLTSSDRHAARLALLAQAIAAQHLRMNEYQKQLDERVCAGDREGSAMFSKLLDGAVRRLVALCTEHRASSSLGQRSTLIAVAHADAVNVEAAE